MDEAWKSLRVGDRIRIVKMPSGIDAPGYQFPAGTRKLYRDLIKRNRPLRIYEIDKWQSPWIRCRFRKHNGTWVHHFLSVRDDSWVLVKTRKKNK